MNLRKNAFSPSDGEISQMINELCLMDDIFMTKCFEESCECTELLLRVILDRQDLKVEKSDTQYAVTSLQGRSLRLDIYAVDTKGKRYNIEIQRKDKGAGAKRARYHSSVLDANVLASGKTFEELPDTYVIFITEHDIQGENQPLYHVERFTMETGEMFGDGAHIIYVNGAYRGDTPIGRLMHDFACTNPDDMYYRELAERTRHFKEKEGAEDMSYMYEDIFERGMERGLERGRSEGIQSGITRGISSVVRGMLEIGKLSCEDIAKYTGMSIDEIKRVAKQ